MTERLFGNTGSRFALDSRLLVWGSIRVAVAWCGLVYLVGCGGVASTTNSTTNSTTSNEDIAAFIEENPEYGSSPAAAGKPSKTSKQKPMGLER